MTDRLCPLCYSKLENLFSVCGCRKNQPEQLMEFKGELGHVLPKTDGEAVTVHHVVTELTKELSKMDEIYVVTKDKEGEWLVSTCGDLGGVAFAIQLLQEYWSQSR